MKEILCQHKNFITNLEDEEKAEFLNDFIKKFKQTKMELTHNIELL